MDQTTMETLLTQTKTKNILITTDDWFTAPDGQMYKAVFGKLNGIFKDDKVLGITTNSKSTNWFAMVGSMIIGGCQIHYAILTDECDCIATYEREELVNDKIKTFPVRSRIWHAK